MSKKRKYSDDYVKYGFTCFVERDGTQKPQCFICSKVLANDSLRPSKLEEHFKKVHPGITDSIEELKVKRARFDASGKLTSHTGYGPSTNKPLVEASYRVAYLIAKNKKPHTIGETLIKPCALQLTEIVLGKTQMQKIAEVPLSNDVIHNRIVDMSGDVTEQLFEELNETELPIGIQLDESTDVSNCSQLLAFVNYVSKKWKNIRAEFLFCEPLLATTKATDVLNMIDQFFSKHGFNWKSKLGFICTDGAPSMLGKKSGFGALVKREAPHVVTSHCYLHRHALACKTLPPNLKSAMDCAVQAVNFIRARALNHRLFKILCQELGAAHEVLLFHTEVRWLSRGRVLSRVMELRKEIAMFLEEKKEYKLNEQFNTHSFVASLAYLADIFSHLNDLNISIQGRQISVLDAKEKVSAFVQKIDLWKKRVSKANYANFPTFEELIMNEEEEIPEGLQDEIVNHLENLKKKFGHYFSDDESSEQDWIRNPFLFNLDTMDDSNMQKDDLIDLKSKALLKQSFQSQTVDEFWFAQLGLYPTLARTALLALIPFATTYLCESGFSTLVTVKTKARNRLNAEHDMRLALSITAPRISSLVERKQQQQSH